MATHPWQRTKRTEPIGTLREQELFYKQVAFRTHRLEYPHDSKVISLEGYVRRVLEEAIEQAEKEEVAPE